MKISKNTSQFSHNQLFNVLGKLLPFLSVNVAN